MSLSTSSSPLPPLYIYYDSISIFFGCVNATYTQQIWYVFPLQSLLRRSSVWVQCESSLSTIDIHTNRELKQKHKKRSSEKNTPSIKTRIQTKLKQQQEQQQKKHFLTKWQRIRITSRKQKKTTNTKRYKAKKKTNKSENNLILYVRVCVLVVVFKCIY